MKTSKKNRNQPTPPELNVPSRMRLYCDDGGIELQAAEPAEDDKPALRQFTMTAYTGGPMRLFGWRYPVTIPLILIGAVVGMLVMQADFGFMVILGFLSLAGSIVNNGIILIDKIETNRSEGDADYDAVVSAAISRLRPILMSVSTTVLGLLPLILSRDPLFYGLACVMAWGLAIGTVFTLVVVPTIYTLFFRVQIPGRRSTAAAPST